MNETCMTMLSIPGTQGCLAPLSLREVSQERRQERHASQLCNTTLKSAVTLRAPWHHLWQEMTVLAGQGATENRSHRRENSSCYVNGDQIYLWKVLTEGEIGGKK